MKYIAFFAWLLASVALVSTIIGLLLFIPSKRGPSAWMRIGLGLIKGIGCDCDCDCGNTERKLLTD